MTVIENMCAVLLEEIGGAKRVPCLETEFASSLYDLLETMANGFSALTQVLKLRSCFFLYFHYHLQSLSIFSDPPACYQYSETPWGVFFFHL